MASKLTIIFLIVGAGVGSVIAGVVGGIFVSYLEGDRVNQHGDRINNGLEDPKAQLSDAEEERSSAQDEFDDAQSNLAQGQPDLANVTRSHEMATLQIELDGKALSIISKIDLEMDLVGNELGEARRALQLADYELALDSVEDARVKMSKVIGQQRQLLNILEGSNGRSADLSNADGNNTEPDRRDSNAFEQVILKSKIHLTIFEDIVDVMLSVSELISDSRQIWNLKDDVDASSTQKDIAQLESQFHDKIVPTLQTALSELDAVKRMQEEKEEKGFNSSITNDTVGIVETLTTLYVENLASLASLPTNENILNFHSMYTSVEDLERLDELRLYALDKINEDRESFGLTPVRLGSNMAAQIHAEDVFKTGEISHWMTNGEKPYMTYTRTGGLGSVFQNVAVGGYPNYQYCLSDVGNDCSKFDPFKSIDTLEYEMVHNDVECCDDGHKYNIINGYHNRVSIGLAYNDYFLVIVQNFENDYIELDGPILAAADTQVVPRTFVNLTGRLPEGYRIFGVTVNYDELPTQSGYMRNKDKNYYDGGQTIGVVQPNGSAIDYDSQFQLGVDYSNIEARKWNEETRHDFGIEFDLSDIQNDEGLATLEGVYTVSVWVQEPSKIDVFIAITYSVFVS